MQAIANAFGVTVAQLISCMVMLLVVCTGLFIGLVALQSWAEAQEQNIEEQEQDQ